MEGKKKVHSSFFISNIYYITQTKNDMDNQTRIKQLIKQSFL